MMMRGQITVAHVVPTPLGVPPIAVQDETTRSAQPPVGLQQACGHGSGTVGLLVNRSKDMLIRWTNVHTCGALVHGPSKQVRFPLWSMPVEATTALRKPFSLLVECHPQKLASALFWVLAARHWWQSPLVGLK